LRQLVIKVLDIIGARCNHEVYCFTSFECQIFKEFFGYFERSYTRTVTCTRRLILHYFSERFAKNE